MTPATPLTAALEVVELDAEPGRVSAAWHAAWAGDPQQPEELDEKLERFYRGNPAGTPRVFALTAGSDREVVGMVALAPRRVSVGGAVHTFALPCDFVVRPDYRRALPALLLQRRAQLRGLEHYSAIYALPGPRATPIFKRLGGMRVVARHRWVRILVHSDPMKQ